MTRTRTDQGAGKAVRDLLKRATGSTAAYVGPAVIVLEQGTAAARYRFDSRTAARRYGLALAAILDDRADSPERFHVQAVGTYAGDQLPETPPTPAEAAARILREPA